MDHSKGNYTEENSILGACLYGQEEYETVKEYVKDPEFFEFGGNRLVFKTIQSLEAEGKPCDITAVTHQLSSTGILDSVGGRDYLIYLTDCARRSNLGYYSAIFAQNYIRRAVKDVCEGFAQQANDPDKDPFELVETLTRELEERTGKFSAARLQNFQEVVDSQVGKLQERIREFSEIGAVVIKGLRFGLADLDRALGGIADDDYVIVGGRPGHGKTALCTQFAEFNGSHGKATLFDSLEMKAGELVDRLLSAGGGVNYSKYQDGNLDEREEVRIYKFAEILRLMPITVDDGFNLTVGGIRNTARKLQREGNLDAIIVDNLQIMDDKSSSRYEKLTNISRNLRMLAREICPVIAISHLSRAVETRPGSNKPMNSDLKEAGGLEQDATKILFVYRPWEYGVDYCKQYHKPLWDYCFEKQMDPNEIFQSIAFVLITKGRKRGTANIPVKWTGSRVRFGDLDNPDLRHFFNLPQHEEPKAGSPF